MFLTVFFISITLLFLYDLAHHFFKRSEVLLLIMRIYLYMIKSL